MPNIEVREGPNTPKYWLSGRPLAEGDQIMLRLGGNSGWVRVSVTGVRGTLKVRTHARDGHPLITSLPVQQEVRWPTSHDDDVVE